jgi:hypothetical protein
VPVSRRRRFTRLRPAEPGPRPFHLPKWEELRRHPFEGALLAAFVMGTLLWPPISLAREAWRLVRATETTRGRIESVDDQRRRGRLVRREVMYTFSADGHYFQGLHQGTWADDPPIVHYDPRDPARSVLVRGLSLTSLGGLLLGWGTALLLVLVDRASDPGELLRPRYAPLLGVPLAGAVLVWFYWPDGPVPFGEWWVVAAAWGFVTLALTISLAGRGARRRAG